MNVRLLLRFALLPLLIYVIAYVVLTFPLILGFSSTYFCDDGDGLQTIWDVWWVQQALTHFHGSIYFTSLLHAPAGAPLWLHSLSPLNGLMGLPLGWLLPQQMVYNLLILFAFAGSGLTAFWLAWDQTRRWWPSLAAGYAFTFSSLHFAHAPGHLHQTATQFLPLYVLLMIRLYRRPSAWRAVAAALALLAVLLCDHYQFLYAAGITAIWLGYEWASGARSSAVRSSLWLAVFTAIFCGPLLFFMGREAAVPLGGLHDPDWFSADLLGLFVPGWTWNFHDLTRPIWEAIGKYSEKSVSIGVAVIVAACFARGKKRAAVPLAAENAPSENSDKAEMQKRPSPQPSSRVQGERVWMRWWLIALVFTVFALGPTLRIDSLEITTAMPYRLLEWLPIFRLSGCPARMMMGTQLAMCVLAAGGLLRLGSFQIIRCSKWRTALAALFVIALIVESEPHIQAVVPATVPPWVTALRDLSVDGAVLELRTDDSSRQLYYQTIHHRAMAFGYLARAPRTLADQDRAIRQKIAAGDINALKEMGFGAIVEGVSAPKRVLRLMYEDREVRIYRL